MTYIYIPNQVLESMARARLKGCEMDIISFYLAKPCNTFSLADISEYMQWDYEECESCFPGIIRSLYARHVLIMRGGGLAVNPNTSDWDVEYRTLTKEEREMTDAEVERLCAEYMAAYDAGTADFEDDPDECQIVNDYRRQIHYEKMAEKRARKATSDRAGA